MGGPPAQTATDPDVHTAVSLRPRPTFSHRRSSLGEHSTNDVELQSLPGYNEANDPYSLRHGLKSADELGQIRANTSRKRKICVPQSVEKGVKERQLKAFYETQNENIERLLKPVDDHVREAKEKQESESLQYKIAVHGSFIANICLAILQVYGAAASGSLALFTTMADAIFDPLSNLTLILCHRAVNHVDPRRFPSGKARIENAGNISFCFLMMAVSLVLIVLSIKDLAGDNGGKPTSEFHLPSTIVVAIAFTTKFCLFLYCYALRNTYSQIRILWEDHRNDLFINGPGLACAVLGAKVRWWIDPMAALILSALIIGLWLRTAYHEFQLLIGVTADTPMLQHITYISMTHSPLILSLDTVRAWHSGPRLIVEVDIVIDQNQTVKESHDVAESLQIKLESLPDVERCYVHIDYETDHAPEHNWKKEL